MKARRALVAASPALTLWAFHRFSRSRLAPAIRIEEGVRSRHPQDLNRGLPDRADGAHRYPGRCYFEWWYFDAGFDDGHSCVAGILDPDIYRPARDRSQVFLHIRTPEGKAYHNFFDFPRRSLRASREGCSLELSGNTIRGSYPRWELELEHGSFAAHLTFTSRLPGWALGSGELLFGSLEHPRVFGWAVPQPLAEVSGWLAYPGARAEVTGTGYHDHNWGNLFMPLYLSHWQWGRILHPEVTVVFAEIFTRKSCGFTRIPLLLLARGGRLELESCRAQWRYGGWRRDRDGVQAYPERAQCRLEERGVRGEMEFQAIREIEANDLLGHAGLPRMLRTAVGKALARPCYYRLLSLYRVSLDLRGERLEVEGECVREYMILGLREGSSPDEGRWRHFLPVVSPPPA